MLRGSVPIGGSPQALKRLYCHSGTLLKHKSTNTIALVLVEKSVFIFIIIFFVGSLKVPFLFLTNGEKFQWLNFLFSGTRNCWIYYNIISSGGGIPESRRAVELSQLLGVNILTWQVLFWYDMDAGLYFSIFLWLIIFWESLMSCCRLYRVTHLLKTCWKGINKILFLNCVYVYFNLMCGYPYCLYIHVWLY